MAFSKKEAPDCDWCPFKGNCFFSVLDRADQKIWNKLRIANRFKPGETIFYEGEKPPGLYVLCTGKIKIYKSSRTGQQFIIRILNPGSLMGYRPHFAQESYAATAEAMQESAVSLMDTESFNKFLMEHPKATLRLLKQLSRDLREGEDKARDMAYKPARVRVSDVLLSLMKKNGSSKPVIHGLKRKDLAEMTGLAVETTVRLLKNLEERGWIKRQRGQIVILDEPKIRSLVGSTN